MQSETREQPFAADPAPVREAKWPLRVRGAVLAVPCLAVLWVAHSLTPRAIGHGTHQELGLPPCAFLSRTGYPCPSCGLTTSTSAVMNGKFVLAFHAHPMGFVIVAGLVAVGGLAFAELLFGRDFLRLLRPGAWWAVVALTSLLGGWGLKVAYGLWTGLLPLR